MPKNIVTIVTSVSEHLALSSS